MADLRTFIRNSPVRQMIDEKVEILFSMDPNARLLIPSLQIAPGLGHMAAANRLSGSSRSVSSENLPKIVERADGFARKIVGSITKEAKERHVNFVEDVAIVDRGLSTLNNQGRFF